MIHALLLLTLASPSSAASLRDVSRSLSGIDYLAVIAALPEIEKKAAAGDPAAQTLLARTYNTGVGGVLDKRKTVALLRQAAAKGDPEAMTLLAIAVNWADGTDAPGDEAAARELRRKARSIYEARANAGDADAMRWMATELQSSAWNQKPDKAGAAAWFAKAKAKLLPAAERGEAKAQYELGDLLMSDFRWNEARPEAAKWLKKSADQGYVPALARLGEYHDHPIADGAAPDYDQARYLWQKAYEAGSTLAAIDLGNHYTFGSRATADDPGHPEDKAKGVEWSLKADALGARWDGCYAAKRLRSGDGVPKDTERALSLLRPRAAAGFDGCLRELADMSRKGEGVPQDDVQALKFYLLSGHSGVDEGEALAKTMSASDVAAAKRKAADFRWTPMPLPEVPKSFAAAQAPAMPAAPAPAAAPEPAPAPASLPERPDDYALIVGIEHYRGLPAADYAEADAASMRERLVGLGFPEQNVISLTGDQATRSSLQAYLEEWLPKNVGPKSRVFFYFSGHGSPEPKTGRAFLVPYDGNPEFLKSTAYPLKDVYADLGKLPAKQVIVALDSCFSGAGGRSVLPKGARPLVAKTSLTSPEGGSLLVFAAAAGDEISGGLDGQGHGAFTYYLLEGLSGAASDKAGAITAGSLQRYLAPKVAKAARRHNRDQTAQLMGDPGAVLFRLK